MLTILRSLAVRCLPLRFVALLVALLALAGCETTYTPGALFAAPASSTHATRRRGCVDVKVSLVDDARVPRSSALLAYELGNGCDDVHVVDLTQVAVTGHVGERSVRLTPFDPRAQLHPTNLDGKRNGDLVVRYNGPGPDLEEVCVDLGSVVEAPEDGYRIVCLAMPGEHFALDPTRSGAYRALGGCSDETRYRNADCSSERLPWETTTTTRLRVDVGLGYHLVPMSGLTLSQPSGPGVSGAALGKLDSGTYDTRVAGFLTRAVYLGGETQLGLGNAPMVAFGVGDGRVQTDGLSVHIVGGAVLGAQSIRAGRFQVRGEVFGGARLVGLTTTGASGAKGESLFAGAWVVEPRAAVDVWVNPNVSIGAWGGTDVIARGAWSSGLSFVLHTRSFDAR